MGLKFLGSIPWKFLSLPAGHVADSLWMHCNTHTSYQPPTKINDYMFQPIVLSTQLKIVQGEDTVETALHDMMMP